MNKPKHQLLAPIFCLVIGILLSLPVKAFGRVSLGISTRANINVGTIFDSNFGLSPDIWCRSEQKDGSEWLVALESSTGKPDRLSGISKVSNLSLWIMRSYMIPIYDLDVHLAGGAGFGLWQYVIRDFKSTRGTMGFITEASIPLKVFPVRGIEVGLGYAGSNVPGTNRVDDAWYLRIRYVVLSNE